MTDNQEYRQEMCKCWEEFLQKHEISTADGVTADAFIMAFDRAYALGKQQKDAESKSMCLSDVKEKIDKWMDSHTEEEVYELLKKYGAVEDADTVTINKGKYYKLCKCSRYMANWVPYFDVCPICGEYNQKGCVCANCHIY